MFNAYTPLESAAGFVCESLNETLRNWYLEEFLKSQIIADLIDFSEFKIANLI